jgi:hypothetical protein
MDFNIAFLRSVTETARQQWPTTLIAGNSRDGDEMILCPWRDKHNPVVPEYSQPPLHLDQIRRCCHQMEELPLPPSNTPLSPPSSNAPGRQHMWECPPPPMSFAGPTVDGEVLLDRAATATGDPMSYIAPPRRTTAPLLWWTTVACLCRR